MTKAKPAKATPGALNKPANSRVQFLYQAAALLAQQDSKILYLPKPETTKSTGVLSAEYPIQTLQPLSRRLVSDLRSVSRKTQIRLSPVIKHSTCKGCNTLLVEGSTYSKEIENRSKGGKKPWADVMVQTCNTCGLAKRFPLTVERQKRRPHRTPKTQEDLGVEAPKGG